MYSVACLIVGSNIWRIMFSKTLNRHQCHRHQRIILPVIRSLSTMLNKAIIKGVICFDDDDRLLLVCVILEREMTYYFQADDSRILAIFNPDTDFSVNELWTENQTLVLLLLKKGYERAINTLSVRRPQTHNTNP